MDDIDRERSEAALKANAAASNGHASVEFAIDETLAAGTWIEPQGIPIPGLRVLLSPYGTKQANRTAAAALRRFGGVRTTDLNDLKLEKRQTALAWITAKAHFLGFKVGDQTAFEIREPGQAKGEGRMINDTQADREFLVDNYKLWREEISDEISALGEAERERVEGIAGN